MPRTKPSLRKIDALALSYRIRTAQLDAAQMFLDSKKAELITLCKHFGFMPAGAEKTLRLEGVEFNIDASFGQSTSVAQALAEEIFKRMQPSISNGLFERRTVYSVAPTAAVTLQALAGFSAKRARDLRDLFAKVQIVTPRAPSLKVSPRTVKVGKRGR